MNAEPIGVLVDRNVLRAALAGRSTYENLAFYREYARPDVCFFTFDGLDLKRRRVRAYEFNGKYLTPRIMTIPRIIHYRAIAFGKHDRYLAGALHHLSGHILFNNPWCGGKLRNSQWLAAEPSTRQFVPETLRYDGAPSLRALLAKYPAIILKPVWGSLGLGLIRVRRAGDGYTWETGTAAHPYFRSTLNAIAAGLRPKTAGRSYLVQRSLDLATYQGHPFDVRVSVQRGADGKWRVSGMVAKVGGRNRIATNVARGGRAVNLMKVLNASFGSAMAQQCFDSLSNLGLKIAPILARHESGMADFGLDLCLTRDGHPWFLEANHRDLRYSFRDAGDRDLWANTYKNPMEYAAYLQAARQPAHESA